MLNTFFFMYNIKQGVCVYNIHNLRSLFTKFIYNSKETGRDAHVAALNQLHCKK